MVRKYLVVRDGMLRECASNGVRFGSISSSDYFPMVVSFDVEPGAYIPVDEIIEKALSAIDPNYHPTYRYLVIPMRDAKVVSMRPKGEYDYTVTDYA